MKTKEEILAHMSENGYTPLAISKILGFLIGAGIKEENEEILINAKNLTRNWADFWEWYNSEEKEEECCNDCPLCGILNELIHIMETETDPKKVQVAHERYEFLVEAFGLDE